MLTDQKKGGAKGKRHTDHVAVHESERARRVSSLPLCNLGSKGIDVLGYPTLDAIIGSVFPNSGIRIYSSAGFAGVVQTFSWSIPGVSGSTTTTGFGFTDGIRAEWPIYPGLDLFLQWRTLLITGQSVGIPGQVTIGGWSNIVTAGIHKTF